MCSARHEACQQCALIAIVTALRVAGTQPGYGYQPGHGGSASMGILCPVGTYNVAGTKRQCAPCPGNRTTSVAGSSDVSACGKYRMKLSVAPRMTMSESANSSSSLCSECVRPPVQQVWVWTTGNLTHSFRRVTSKPDIVVQRNCMLQLQAPPRDITLHKTTS